MQSANTQSAFPLADAGVLRAAINMANPALAKSGPDGPVGITVDLSHGLAAHLGVRLEIVTCESATKAVDALKTGDCDISFMAIDPAREDDFAFSASYLTIEGVYGVPNDGPLDTSESVDQPGVTVASTSGTAYTQFLTRSLKNAELVTSQNGFEEYRDKNCSAVAGIREAVERFVEERGNMRVLAPAFMTIKQAVAVQKARGALALPVINDVLTRHFSA